MKALYDQGAIKSLLQGLVRVSIFFLAALSSGTAFAAGGGIRVQDAQDPSNWASYYRTNNGWRFSPLDQVNKTNVKKLKVAWIHQPGDITSGLPGTPLEIDGTLYYMSAFNKVQALDATTGQEIWRFQPQLDPLVNEHVLAGASRGVTIGFGKVYFGTLDGRIMALDQGTGKLVWEHMVTKLKENYENFTSPPLLAGNVLVFGTCCADYPMKSKIYAMDAQSGEPAWTFETIKDDPKSWPGDSGKIGGGTAWMTGTYDAETQTVFLGTSNASPDSYGDERRGDNLYTSSVLALDAKTGKLKWYVQETPHDTFDYDSAYEPLLIERDGKPYVVHLSKNGFVFVMGRQTGKLENVWPLAKYITWVKKINPKTGEAVGRLILEKGKESMICPSYVGIRSWNHGAYSPKTKLWYTNVLEQCGMIVPGQNDPQKNSLANPAYGVERLKMVPPPSGKGEARLDARDPFTGKVRWSVPYAVPGLSTVLATGGGLIFNGDYDGMIRAFDDDTGKELWHFNTGSGIRSGLITYAVKGKQYIIIPTGYPSYLPSFLADVWPALRTANGGAALIAFTLE